MNTTKKIITAVFIMFYFCSFCNAQKKRHITASQWLEIHKKDIKSNAYIFEGTVIQQSTISKTIVTCSVIKITKIYKGSPQIKLGTIKVITEQSTVQNGMILQDAGPGLDLDGKYIIFGNPTNTKVFDSIETNYPIPLLCIDLIDLHSKSSYTYLTPSQEDSLIKNHRPLPSFRPAAVWGETIYKSMDSLYLFFKENGITMQEEQTDSANQK